MSPNRGDDALNQDVYVTPRCLAGTGGDFDAAFAPVDNWPHHHLDDGPCQLLVTSPDHRIRIGFFGDDFELLRISAAEDSAAPAAWQATFNHTFPPEIAAGLTSALAHDWTPEGERFLAGPSIYWRDPVRPLLDAGWVRNPAAAPGTIAVLSQGGHAGAVIDDRVWRPGSLGVLLWAGPPGWDTRAEAMFTVGTPDHLVAATAAAMIDPSPVIRERHMLHLDIEHLVELEPVRTEDHTRPKTPTPLDAKHAAVSAAVQRAQATRNRTTPPRPRPGTVPTTDAPGRTTPRSRR